MPSLFEGAELDCNIAEPLAQVAADMTDSSATSGTTRLKGMPPPLHAFPSRACWHLGNRFNGQDGQVW